MILKGYLQRVTVNLGIAGVSLSTFTTILLAEGQVSPITVSKREATEMGSGIYEFSFLVPIDDPYYHYHLRIINATYSVDTGFEFYPQEIRCGRLAVLTIQALVPSITDWVTYLAKDGVVSTLKVTVTEVTALGVGMYQVSFVPDWDTQAHHYELRITSATAMVDSGWGFDVPPGRLLDVPSRYPTLRGSVELVGIKPSYQLSDGRVLKKKTDLDFVASASEDQDPPLPFVTFPFVAKRFVIFDEDGTRYVADAILAANEQITPANSKYALTIYQDGSIFYYNQFTVAATDLEFPPILPLINQLGAFYDA